MSVETPEREAPAEAIPPASEWPYEFRIVQLSTTFVDAAYQRPLSNLVHKVAREFDPALVGALVLSERSDGRCAVVDGQTRVQGALKRGTPDALPAIVFKGLTRAQEADLFHRLQRERRNMASYDGFRAALVAGDKDAKAIKRIADSVGYTLGRSDGNQQNLTAVAALAAAYKRSPENLERVLIILKEAWGPPREGEPDRHIPTGVVIRGLSYWIAMRLKDGKEIDDGRMARHLSIQGPDNVNRKASAIREGIGGGSGSQKYVSMALDAIYART